MKLLINGGNESAHDLPRQLVKDVYKSYFWVYFRCCLLNRTVSVADTGTAFIVAVKGTGSQDVSIS